MRKEMRTISIQLLKQFLNMVVEWEKLSITKFRVRIVPASPTWNITVCLLIPCSTLVLTIPLVFPISVWLSDPGPFFAYGSVWEALDSLQCEHTSEGHSIALVPWGDAGVGLARTSWPWTLRCSAQEIFHLDTSPQLFILASHVWIGFFFPLLYGSLYF